MSVDDPGRQYGAVATRMAGIPRAKGHRQRVGLEIRLEESEPEVHTRDRTATSVSSRDTLSLGRARTRRLNDRGRLRPEKEPFGLRARLSGISPG